jgi:CRISPR-associated protein Cas1
MRYLNTLYVTDHRARITFRRGSFEVHREAGRTRVPIEAVDGIVLLSRAQVTTDALAACAERNIRVAALKMNGALRFVVGGPTSGNVHLRIAQVRASDDPTHRLSIARSFVGGKLRNSWTVVSRWGRDATPTDRRRIRERAEAIAERLARVPRAESEDQLRGLEGDAARAHFTVLGAVLADARLSFVGRQRRPPRDPVNALLSFCYGLLVTETTGALDAVGLDPQVGFLHRPRSGRPSLALDLAEELRPLTDRFVVTAVRRGEVGAEDFVKTPGGAVYLSESGRSKVLTLWERHKNVTYGHKVAGHDVARWAVPAVQATLLARHLRGDIPMYPPFVLPW